MLTFAVLLPVALSGCRLDVVRPGETPDLDSVFREYPGYAGSWVESGRTVVALVFGTDPGPFVAEAPASRVVFVEHSLLELDEAAAAVDANLGEFAKRGIKFVFVERDIMANRIRVGLQDPTPADVAFVQSLGDSITVEDADPVIGN